MKKTQKKDAFRNIRKRIVSYLSVALVIMLGLGGVFITRYMGAGINAEATGYYNDHGFKTYELISSLGATDDDVAQIRETEGVTDAEGVIRASASLSKGELNHSVEVISMTERISVPEVVEGKAPAAKDECMIGEDFALESGLKVGDKVKIIMSGVGSSEVSFEDSLTEEDAEKAGENAEEESADEEEDVLYAEEFTITGLMKHPDYLRRKSTDTVVLSWAAYNKDVTDGLYTHVFVKSPDPEGTDIFSDKYFKKTASTKKSLEELTEILAVDSADRAKAKAYAKIDEEWQKALAELEEAQDEIDSGEAEMNSKLADARDELEEAERLLNSKVSDYNKQIKAAENKIKAAEKKIKEAKEYLKLIDKNLPDAKKYVKELREQYNGDLDQALNDLAAAREMIDRIRRYTEGSEEYKQAVMALADFVLAKEETIRKVHDFCGKENVIAVAEKFKELSGIDLVTPLQAIAGFHIQELFDLATAIKNGGTEYLALISKTEELIASIEDTLKKLDEAEKYIEDYEKNRESYYKQVAEKEKELKDKKKELAEAKARLASEKKKYNAEIRDGWNLYYSQKSAYEKKLEEAKALLAENRELAEQKLEEAKAEVEKIECRWLVFDRRANAGYVDIKSNLSAVGSAGLIFGILFMLISAIVCFSTLTIIIDEQKKMVGTVKAFGFLKGEILGKYLVFGVTAAIIGCIAGILLALGLSGVVLKAYHNSGMYQFAMAKSVITVGSTLIACGLMVLICAIATVIACSDILKSPASILMKGGTAKKGSGYRKKTASKKGGSLYSRLIIRNMLDDKARVAISIIIIAFSTLLMGVGISMKLGYDGMTDKQVNTVYKYDVRADIGNKVTADDMKKIEEAMTADGAEFTKASYETHIFHLGDRLDALYVLTGDPEVLGDYFAVSDIKTGEQLALPEDGVLIQKKMKESYGMNVGTDITVLDSSLDEKTATVKGVFNNYVGRLMITSPAGYKHTFGEDPTYNCYYIKANGTDLEKLQSDVLAVNGDVSFEIARDFAKKFEAVSFLYNLIVYVTTGIAILMSAMILSNLANIFLNRKKTELTVMRINGFSIKQTKGYLSKESIVTTAAGVIIGVLGGVVAAPLIIRAMEQPDLQFVRTFHPVAWLIAVALEVLFAVVINSLVFRKVKDLNFRDVA